MRKSRQLLPLSSFPGATKCASLSHLHLDPNEAAIHTLLLQLKTPTSSDSSG